MADKFYLRFSLDLCIYTLYSTSYCRFHPTEIGLLFFM